MVEAPVCVYCDTLLYLDDRLVLMEAEEDKDETEETQSAGPEDGPSSVAQNGETISCLDKIWSFHDSEN